MQNIFKFLTVFTAVFSSNNIFCSSEIPANDPNQPRNHTMTSITGTGLNLPKPEFPDDSDFTSNPNDISKCLRQFNLSETIGDYTVAAVLKKRKRP